MNLTPNMRSVLVNWVHAVHSKLRLCDGVFEMAIATIDRYLQQWVKDISPSDLNLMGFSALVLASKYENPKMTHIQWFLKHTDAGFTDEMISEMVLQILLAINCDLSRPVPSQFLKRLCNATADFGIKCQKLAHYYVQLALMDAELASVKPSQIAAAALYIALNLSDGTPDGGLDESLWTRQLADCSRYTSLQLRATVLRMAQLPLKAEQEELLSIRNKFSRRKYYSVSVAPELKGPRLESIMNIPENEPSSLSQLPLKAEQVPMSIRQKCSRRKYNSVLVAPELKEPRLESIVNIPEKIPRSIRFKQTFCNLM
ncbi:blast:G2/mitotic-specific cyclin-B [Drosophila guanche]|nr:blast:G2/mitotic-specific cyclin-B [Drosophila guanche]